MISFGTSCMGRLHHLEKTYIPNIETALCFDSTYTFTLLNWNSSDGMDKWVEQNLNEYIKNGIVKYIHTKKPTEFSQSITKNITMKNSRGDIVCNLDADNFLNKKFLQKVNDIFCSHEPIIVSGEQAKGIAGRIVCRKEHLCELKGFDESLEGWGYEDLDFIARFEKYYDTKCIKLGFDFLGKAINTDHDRNANRCGINRKISRLKISSGQLISNIEHWGVVP